MPAAVRRFALIAATVVLGLVVLFLAAWATDSAVLSGQVARNVDLDGRVVGGLSDTELRTVVSGIATGYESKPVHLTTPTGSIETTLMGLGVTVDQPATVNDTLDIGRSNAFFMRPIDWGARLASPRRAPLRFTVNPPQVAAKIATLEPDNLTEPTEPTLTINDGTIVVEPGRPGRSLDTRALSDQLERDAANGQDSIDLNVNAIAVAPRTTDAEMGELAAEANRITASPVDVTLGQATATVSTAMLRTWMSAPPSSPEAPAAPTAGLAIDQARAAADLTTLLGPLGDAPTDLTWSVGPDNKATFTDGRVGSACCTPASLDGILTALHSGTGTAVLAPATTPPVHDAAWAKTLGIGEQISTFTTKYPAGQPRVINIHRIADIVRGMVIEPGQTWSLNGSVGKRTVARGFVEAPVIYQGEHDTDVGGGVSQFATTTFNAAFFGGLDFQEYQSHSLYISRYPYGREGTVSWPQPDLKITNRTPYGILIWPTYTATSLTVTLYSTPWVTGEQTGQSEKPKGACILVTTERTRTWASDGHKEVDTVFATYRPAEGIDC